MGTYRIACNPLLDAVRTKDNNLTTRGHKWSTDLTANFLVNETGKINISLIAAFGIFNFLNRPVVDTESESDRGVTCTNVSESESEFWTGEAVQNVPLRPASLLISWLEYCIGDVVRNVALGLVSLAPFAHSFLMGGAV